MTRPILRMALSTLALLVLFAGSFNLNRTSAQQDSEVVTGSGCGEYACAGGPCLCAVIILPDGTEIKCFMKCY